MKPLYINIDQIHIRGDAGVLTQVVMDMDRRLFEIAEKTESIKATIFKYSGSNQGKQYNKAAKAMFALSKYLVTASNSLNDMQVEIVRFQNKTFVYEDMSSRATQPRKHHVQEAQVNVNTGIVKFERPEMETVKNALKNYTTDIRREFQILRQNKDNIGSVWLDSQYKDFSEFIESLISESNQYISLLEEYTEYLETRIRGLL